jgi:probable HAF family extracellular repeat protein
MKIGTPRFAPSGASISSLAVYLHAQTYTLTDLGALPGNPRSTAYGLNNLGQAVGTSDLSAGSPVATLFSNGTVTNMNTLNASSSIATSISGPVKPQAITSLHRVRTLFFELFCTATEP